MTILDHLDALGVIAKPAPKPEPPPVDRTNRGWVPAYKGEECPW